MAASDETISESRGERKSDDATLCDHTSKDYPPHLHRRTGYNISTGWPLTTSVVNSLDKSKEPLRCASRRLWGKPVHLAVLIDKRPFRCLLAVL